MYNLVYRRSNVWNLNDGAFAGGSLDRSSSTAGEKRPQVRGSQYGLLSVAPVLLAFTGIFLCITRLGAQTTARLQSVAAEHGVIVEQVDKGSEAESAGLQVGDVVFAWSRGLAEGLIESPFGWTDVVIEQAPRGTLTLRGLRNNQERVWSLGLRQWGLTVGPVMRAGLKASYEQCRGLGQTDKHGEAAHCWKSILALAQASDPPWLASWLLSQIADSLVRRQQWQEAEEAYRGAVTRSDAAGQTVTAQLLEAWGVAMSDRDDLAKTEERLGRAQAIREKLAPGSLAVARSLSNVGGVALDHDDLPKANEYYRQALSIREKLAPGSLDFAKSLAVKGNVAFYRGDLAEAEDYHRKAFAIRERLALPGSLDIAESLNVFGIVAWRRGDLTDAEEFLRQALVIYERLSPNSLNATSALNGIGNVAWNRGDLAKAEEYFLQMLAIRQNLAPGGVEVAGALYNLGIVAQQRGDLARARDYYNQALRIQQKVAPGSLGVAGTLSAIGGLALDRGDFAKAEDYLNQALEVQQQLAPGTVDVADTLNTMGTVAQKRGHLPESAGYYHRALQILQTLAPNTLWAASSLKGLGKVAEARGEFVPATEYYGQALAIEQKLAPGSLDEATTLHALGVVLLRKGESDAGIAHFADAIQALESQTARLGGIESIRSGFQVKYATYYWDFEDALLAQKQPEQAYQVSERSRARSLLHMLAERDLVFAADVPPDIQRARKRNAAEYDHTQSQVAELNPAKDQAKIDQLLARLRELTTEREQIAEQIKKTSPRFASLQYPEPLDLASTRQILDPGTFLLSYSVGQEHTVMYLVRPAGREPGFFVFTLAVKEKDLLARVQDFRRLMQHHQVADRQLTALSRQLYDLLLKPAESLLDESDRLLIVPDGALQILPFAALRRNEKEYLVEWKPLHTVVSATVYAELKKMRRMAGSQAVALAAFGDPRVPAAKDALERSANTEVRLASERGFEFGWLPFSRQEVEGIAALFPGRSQTYLGADATEEHAKALGKDVRYVHFATHGLLDERFPLNSALVLTIPDKFEEGKENGLLQAWEIFEQVRLDADLVTLSACNTGLGQEMSGEGLIGLTRAFQYAGARSVLASLWSVDDLRTMELMKRFYSGLRDGKSKDEALRAAQISLLRSRPSSSPYYWAAFSLIGDWH